MKGVIIIDEDVKTREVLQQMLQTLGFKNVRTSHELDSVDWLFQEFPDGVSLILASERAAGGFDVPLSRFVIQRRDLDLAPLILTSDRWSRKSTLDFSLKLSRVDDFLPKPFNAQMLYQSIAIAHRTRAKMRNALVVINQGDVSPAADGVFNSDLGAHWTTLSQVRTPQEFDEVVDRLKFRIGSIVVHSSSCDTQMLERLNKFKKTNLGANTSVIAVGPGAKELAPLRSFAQLFFSHLKSNDHHEWSEALHLLSVRHVTTWEAKQLLGVAKSFLNEGKYKKAEKSLKEALNLDPERWEFHEFAGELAFAQNKSDDAVKAFTQVLKTNPFSPLPYLRLATLLDSSLRAELIELATSYCPANPQILKALGLEKTLEKPTEKKVA